MPSNERLHRRTIRAALMARHGWEIKSRVDGWVEITVPARERGDMQGFAKAVERAVRELGYVPTIATEHGAVLVRTPETLAQAGRGGHGFNAQLTVAVPPIASHLPLAEDATDAEGVVAPLDLPPVSALGQWVEGLRPDAPPYRDTLSTDSPLMVWHVDLLFEQYTPTREEKARWADKDSASAETWNKTLLVGRDSGHTPSCGEIEIAARLRAAGYEAYWVSEWLAFPHVPAWRPWCVKRSELRDRLPVAAAFDSALRARFPQLGLGAAGGHPDVVAWRPGEDQLLFAEYKSPGDSMKAKQIAWATALRLLDPGTHRYVAVRGIVA